MGNNKQTVLITGASSGIGFSTALHLAEKGCLVIGTSRSKSRLEELERQAEVKKLSVVGVQLDINTDQAVEKLVPELLDRYGKVDALVNNAGYGLWGPLQTLSSEQVKLQFETNVFAAFRMMRAVLPGMVERGGGTIINISSVAGRVPTPFSSIYAASKFALEGMSEALRMEVQPFGIRVVVVEPGLFKTGFHDRQSRDNAVNPHESPYKNLISTYDRKHALIMPLARDPIGVARTVHRILSSRNPAFRYPVGLEAWLGGIGARLVPERLFHTLIRRSVM